MTRIKRTVVTILSGEHVPDEDKITVPRQLEADSLSKERSATEGMTPVEGEDLNTIENALRRLGEDPVDVGAAPL